MSQFPLAERRFERFHRPVWVDWVVKDLGCRTRILMVADGLTFGDGGFGLSEAVEIVKAATTTNQDLEVVTAHRNTDPDADVSGFTFTGNHDVNGDSRSIHAYQEIWLFALESVGTMEAEEVTEISKFMDQGGGVLAMGDHAALGARMCGEIPRVKSMRHWYSPPAPSGTGSGRIDTNVSSPGADPQFDLQSDNIPQRIYPVWYGDPTDSVPHPLLGFADGVVTYLPDHPHEGRCVVPSSLDPDEYPNDSEGDPVAPEIVAWGVSGGPGFSGSKPAVSPTLFGVIGAYDGHRAGVGRVAVDSTWHHWININLNGTGSAPLSGGVATQGLYDSNGDPTPEYLQIQAYFQNLAGWLEPNHLRICWMLVRVLRLRYEWPLFEEIPVDGPIPPERLEEIGRLGLDAVRRRDGVAAAQQLVSLLAAQLDLPAAERALVDPWAARKADAPEAPAQVRSRLAQALVGGAVAELAQRLPEDPSRVVSALRELAPKKGEGIDERRLAALLTEGARVGVRALSERLGQEAKRAQAFCGAIAQR